MTRDPARIDPILADLRRYWHAAPDLRLGQMVMGLLNLSGAPRYGEFNAEDDKIAAYLAAWAAANQPPPDHRDTMPPEIEAAIAAAAWTVAELDRRADVMAQPEIADLRTAITSALAAIAADKAALDATWRAHDLERDAEVAQAQAATREACAALQAICAALHVTPPTGSTYCAGAVAMVVERVAADKARAVEGMRPVLSQADAERLVGDFNASPYDGSNDCPARAALLAALTGADAPKPTQCGAVDMLRGTICPTCGARKEFVPGPPTGEIRRQMDAAAVEMCADCAALAGAGGGR